LEPLSQPGVDANVASTRNARAWAAATVASNRS
jgi:hypothetical protein